MSNKKKKDKKRVDMDIRPHGPLFKNYDYGGPEDGSDISPGTGLYHGKMDKYKSVSDFLEKARKRKYRKKALYMILNKKQMKNKKIIKLAVIRSDDSLPCPFGLPVSSACHSVGNIIKNMAPLDIMGPHSSDEEKKEIATANNHLFRWKSEGTMCPYAGKLFPQNEKVVECNWASNAPEAHDRKALLGSPFYHHHFSGMGPGGMGLEGLHTFPLGYYQNSSIDAGIYYGPFSLESVASEEEKHTNKK
jgi:hypothetical protein